MLCVHGQKSCAWCVSAVVVGRASTSRLGQPLHRDDADDARERSKQHAEGEAADADAYQTDGRRTEEPG